MRNCYHIYGLKEKSTSTNKTNNSFIKLYTRYRKSRRKINTFKYYTFVQQFCTNINFQYRKQICKFKITPINKFKHSKILTLKGASEICSRRVKL